MNAELRTFLDKLLGSEQRMRSQPTKMGMNGQTTGDVTREARMSPTTSPHNQKAHSCIYILPKHRLRRSRFRQSTLTLMYGCIAILLLAASPIVASTEVKAFISGYIETKAGFRLRNQRVDITQVGTFWTTERGDFHYPLPAGYGDGDLVILYIDGWIFLDPREGRVTVSPLSKNIKLLVESRANYSYLLTDRQFIRNFLVKTANVIASPQSKAETQTDLLIKESKQLGVSAEALSSAIVTWGYKAENPYEKGLAALYAGEYENASVYIRDSVEQSNANLADKFLSLATAEFKQGHLDTAEAALNRARSIVPNDPLILHNLAIVLAIGGKLSEAISSSEQAIATNQKALGRDSPILARDLSDLAGMYFVEGKDYQKAEFLASRALSIDEKHLGPMHPDVADDLSNIAAIFQAQGRKQLALVHFERALLIYQNDPTTPSRVLADATNNLALMLEELGRHEEAASHRKEAQYYLALPQ